jgi:hypothetical protein
MTRGRGVRVEPEGVPRKSSGALRSIDTHAGVVDVEAWARSSRNAYAIGQGARSLAPVLADYQSGAPRHL